MENSSEKILCEEILKIMNELLEKRNELQACIYKIQNGISSSKEDMKTEASFNAESIIDFVSNEKFKTNLRINKNKKSFSMLKEKLFNSDSKSDESIRIPTHRHVFSDDFSIKQSIKPKPEIIENESSIDKNELKIEKDEKRMCKFCNVI